jgi:selenocysteine lyase/cysteine desulfurase
MVSNSLDCDDSGRMSDPSAIEAWPPTMPVALGDRSGFPRLAARAYLGHSAISPLSQVVEQAIAAVSLDYATRGIEAFMTWHERRGLLRARMATLLDAELDEVGFVANTTTAVSTIALNLPWQRGDDVIVLRGEFPANVTPWQRAAELHGLHVEFHDVDEFAGASGRGLERLEQRLRQGGVRLIAVSAVQFQSGLRMPLQAIATLAHQHGAELFCDAIQALGVLDLRPRALGIDYLACGSHKWLMGSEGAALLWIARERLAGLRHFNAGWLSHEHAVDFLFESDQLRYDRPIRQAADHVEVGAYPVLGLAALAAALEPLLALGTTAIEQHVTRYLDVLDEGLRARGLVSLRSDVVEQRSAILSVRAPIGSDAREIQARLGRRGIVMTIPEGLLRFAPHWPNALDEVPEVLAALDEVLA